MEPIDRFNRNQDSHIAEVFIMEVVVLESIVS